jgi:transposase-like protein
MSKAASRIFSREFKLSAVHRMLSGENVSTVTIGVRLDLSIAAQPRNVRATGR